MWFAIFTWLLGTIVVPPTEARISTWKEECPAGYVLVPRNTEYVDQNFCVMKYEAKAKADSGGAIDADGCLEAGCTTNNWGVASNSPASDPTGLPWRKIDYTNALAECRSLGPRYDLISNAEWQTIGRNLEVVASNWTSGTIGSGCVFTGNTNDATCGYNGADPEGGTGRNTRARLFLSNGQEIWDFSGNVTEWVADPNTTGYGADVFMSGITTASHTTSGILNDQVARVGKNQFGPAGTYAGCNNGTNDYCGLGHGWLSPANGAMARGGNYNDTFYSGLFMSYLLNGTGGGGSNNTGFRCVYRPNDPCLSGKNITPGTRCGGPTQPTASQVFVGQFLGYDYYTTPSGCTNSSTPTCAGGTDTVAKNWTGSGSGGVDIAALTNITTYPDPAPSTEPGAYSTPIVAAAGSVGSDAAAPFCENMSYAGFTDWHLPNKSELSLLYCAANSSSHNTSYPQMAPDCYTLGGKRNYLTGFAASRYSSSSEHSTNNYWAGDMNTGYLESDGKSCAGCNVRCMRREPSRDPCAGNPTIGTTCRGGALYAGLFDGGKYMITPSGCNDSSTPVCGGGTDSVSKFYRGSTGSNADIAGLTNFFTQAWASFSSERGHVATPILINAASISSDSAADYCANLVYGGFTDWYLPSKSEAAYIYCRSNAPSHNTLYPHEDPNCLMSGGKTSQLTGFNTSTTYWTSTELDTNTGWHQVFSDGGQYGTTKDQSNYIRCVRRYDTLAPSRVQLAAAVNDSTTANLTTASFTPQNNSLLVAVVGGVTTNGNPTITVSGGGLTWTSRVSTTNSSSAFPDWHSFSSIWTAQVTTGASMTVTLSVGGLNVDGKSVTVYQYTGHDQTSPIGATITGIRDNAEGRWTMNLSGTPAIDSEVIATAAVNNWDGSGSDNIRNGTGWTQILNNGLVGPETQVQIQTRAAPSSNVVGWTVVDALEATGANATAAAIEIKISAGCPSGGAMVGGQCWYYSGTAGNSCDAVCSGVGRTCNLAATRDFAGSGGTDAACKLVLDALGAPGTTAVAMPGSPLGCFYGGGRFRGTTATTCTGGGAVLRACACD